MPAVARATTVGLSRPRRRDLSIGLATATSVAAAFTGKATSATAVSVFRALVSAADVGGF